MVLGGLVGARRDRCAASSAAMPASLALQEAVARAADQARRCCALAAADQELARCDDVHPTAQTSLACLPGKLSPGVVAPCDESLAALRVQRGAACTQWERMTLGTAAANTEASDAISLFVNGLAQHNLCCLSSLQTAQWMRCGDKLNLP